jgi:hypothetical protein
MQACSYVAPAPSACTYTYSAWGACQPSSTQTRTVASSSPAGCAGTPALTQACTYVAPPPAPTGLLFPPTTTVAKAPEPSLSEPPLGASALFADLGTTVTHVSDSPHHYAKDSPWNSDESLAMTNDGKVYDGQTYQYLRTISLPSEHHTWSNTDPRYVYGANRTALQWVRLDATNGTMTTLKTYSASDVGQSSLSSMSYGDYEGNTDNNDTGAVLIADGVRPVLINPQTGAVRCYVTSGGGYGNSVSDTTISQDGNWILVNWSGYGKDAYRASDCSFYRKMVDTTGHYDACVSTAGDQVIVYGYDASMLMQRISDGQITTLYTDATQREHISCRNLKRPGWAYYSVENTTCDSTQNNIAALHRVLALKLDGSRSVQLFGWDHQPCPSTYASSPMAAPSPLGTRVWWKTNWDGSANVHSFVAQQK